MSALDLTNGYAEIPDAVKGNGAALRDIVLEHRDAPAPEPEATATLPFVSVIVPTFNELPMLSKCVEALRAQSYPADRYEVIVVDNGSEPSHFAALEELCAGFENVRVAYEARPGSYAARNLGLSLARGEMIGFTDSDCLPARDWIMTGVTHLKNAPNLGLVVGAVHLYPQGETANAYELYDSLIHFRQEDFCTNFRYGCTANVFTRASVVEKVGRFDAGLKSGGDKEFGQRIFAHGYDQIFARDLVIRHPARGSIEKLVNKGKRLVGGLADEDKKIGTTFFEQLRNEKRIYEWLNGKLAEKSTWSARPGRLELHGIAFAIHFARAVELFRLRFFGKVSVRT
jgi:cellulose synthase/poly-beta-1,6-N-acetylglucosamine synthase-like glycosyltransferase